MKKRSILLFIARSRLLIIIKTIFTFRLWTPKSIALNWPRGNGGRSPTTCAERLFGIWELHCKHYLFIWYRISNHWNFIMVWQLFLWCCYGISCQKVQDGCWAKAKIPELWKYSKRLANSTEENTRLDFFPPWKKTKEKSRNLLFLTFFVLNPSAGILWAYAPSGLSFVLVILALWTTLRSTTGTSIWSSRSRLWSWCPRL